MESEGAFAEVQAMENFRRKLEEAAKEYYFDEKGQNILNDNSPENIKKLQLAEEKISELISDIRRQGVVPDNKIQEIADQILGGIRKIENKE